MTFTSDLSIDEVLLVRDIGFEPVDFVMGSSYFHVGWTMAPWGESAELPQLSEVLHDARTYAMSDLLKATAECGADGVVGVRLEIHHHGDHANFTMIGTAVKRRDGTGAAWRTQHEPFSCDLDGHAFWALVSAGYAPRKFVFGNCVYHVAHQTLGAWAKQLGANMENALFTQGLYDAREITMERLQSDATRAGATGVLGIRTHEGRFGWSSHIIEFSAYGTAVVASPLGAAGALRPIEVVISARDG